MRAHCSGGMGPEGSTTKLQTFSPTLPALSLAVSVTVFGPTVLVSTNADGDRTKERDSASVALPWYSVRELPWTQRRAGAHSIVGGVVSRRAPDRCVVVPPALVAVHSNVAPAVSAVTRCGSQPEVVSDSRDSGSVTNQVTSTSLRYQPFSPCVPVTTASTTGGDQSSCAAAGAGASRRAIRPARNVRRMEPGILHAAPAAVKSGRRGERAAGTAGAARPAAASAGTAA